MENRQIVYATISIVAVIINLISYAPQIIQLIQTKRPEDVSLKSNILFTVGCILYLAIMFMDNASLSLLLLQGFELILCGLTAILIFIYKGKN